MRRLAETGVLKSAAIAALAVSVACHPRLALWSNPAYPIWYLQAVLLLGGFVLWAFVFAWHTKYSGRQVFNFRLETVPCVVATVAGILISFILHEFVDPAFRARTPEDYPASLGEWVAMTLFSLGFNQLFLVFAPFAWALRLSKRSWFAILFTVLFGVFVAVIKTRSSPTPIAPSLFCTILIVRAGVSFLTKWFFSRHGVILAWWWGFLLQARHLLDLVRDL